MAERGQAIVEFALVTPIMLSILLAVVSVFYLQISRDRMQNAVTVLAMIAAENNGRWHSLVPDEDVRSKCNSSAHPVDTYPDGNSNPGSRIVLTWTCRLDTHGWLFDGTPITVSSEAVLR